MHSIRKKLNSLSAAATITTTTNTVDAVYKELLTLTQSPPE